VVGPIVVACVGFVILLAAQVTRRGSSPGKAALASWAAFPNGAFWVLPVAGALVGPAATTIAALSNAAYSAPGALCIHLLRRDAPVPQRRATSWIDQSALLAVFVGLLLHLAGPAPEGTKWVLYVAGPLLAFVGAALFTGSILHPHNLAVGFPRIDVRRWLALSAVRVAYFVPVAVLAGSTALTVIAVLSALGPPAFNPPQLAVLYGYRSGVVNAAARFGWVLLPIGLAAAAVLR